MARVPAQPFFLTVAGGACRDGSAADGDLRIDPATHDIFCLHHAPPGAARGAVVYVPPFTEEMNKSRRMAALQSRALADVGWHVLQIDLAGTGDSEGDFADARWSTWLADIAAARQWLRDEAGREPWLWGLRLGALLAAESLRLAPADGAGLLLWQPVLSGRQHLQQFLRLKAGAEWLGAGGRGAASAVSEPSGRAPSTATSDVAFDAGSAASATAVFDGSPGARSGVSPDARSGSSPAATASSAAKPIDQLRAGETVEIAGYALAPGLALPMDETQWRWPAGLTRAAWFEVSPRDGATLSPASERLLATAPAGCGLRSAVLTGPSFWQATEIETAPALIAASTEALIAAVAETPST